jgi:hypothetical protein
MKTEVKFYAHPQNDHTVITDDGDKKTMWTIGNCELTNPREFKGSKMALSRIPYYQAEMIGWTKQF